MKTRNAVWLGAVAASAALSVMPAAAQNWYIGAGVGQGDADEAVKKETVWTGRLGYMFTPYIGVEAAYYDLGKFRFEGSLFGIPIRGSAKTQAWGGALVGVVPVMDTFQAYGRLGYARMKEDFTLDAGDPERFKQREKENAAYWGLGARYMFTKQVGAFAEYTKHEKIDVQSWMLGVHFAF